MLLVIFGAGASYDSIPSKPLPLPFTGLLSNEINAPLAIEFRPPLANELFADRIFMADWVNNFPHCQPIIPYLRNLGGKTVEQVLQELQEEGQHNPRRRKQMAAVQYYLQSMLFECTNHWNPEAKGVTNYKTLLDQIEHCRKPKERVSIVTFNYDTLVESALHEVGLTIRSMDDYINHDIFSLIKVHGSINWAREVITSITVSQSKSKLDLAQELIEDIDQLNITDNYRMIEEYPISSVGSTCFFPALAIPVERKSTFVCPNDHFDALVQILKEVKKFLIIGWRATEEHFLNLLSQNIGKKRIQVLTVAGNHSEGDDINHSILQYIPEGSFQSAEGGFTQFVVNRAGEKFLRS